MVRTIRFGDCDPTGTIPSVRTWELLTVALDSGRGSPLYLQLANAISDGIGNGRFKPREALPGTRVLAQQLGVHRGTVIAAYQELVAQGLARTRQGGGTFVAEPAVPHGPSAGARPPATPPTFMVPQAPPLWPLHLPDPLGPLMMHGGLPDVRLLPAEALARAFRRALARHGRRLLSYGDPRGHERLRREIASMLSHTRGLSAEPSDVIVTRGSQQALYLVAQALLSPGDLVAVEELGNPRVWSALRLPGAELAPIPVDDEGLDVDALALLIDRRRLRAVYLTPHHQFPTGAIMSPARRARLAALALEHRFAILEDDYDREFHYEGQPLAPIAAGAGRANVIYLGTLSKVLAPGLRVGYIVAPPSVLELLVGLRGVCDMQGDAVVECAIAELFEDGELLRHVRRMREIYRRRRDVLAAALARHLGHALTFRVPAGGMAIWARVEDGTDLDRWARSGEALGVRFRGGGMFDYLGRALPYLRLGFTYHDEAELTDAAARMARALGACGS
jgi:GntR family transcriptional regulator/MocR family aminotransferase